MLQEVATAAGKETVVSVHAYALGWSSEALPS
jgi:hypothetical protein